MIKKSGIERRATIRAKRVLSIQYRQVRSIQSKSTAQWHLSTTENMSAGGLAFLTDIPFKANDTLELHVVMSGILDIFTGFGKVVRIERKKTAAYYLVGVKFLNLDAQKRKAKTYQTSSRQKSPLKRKTSRKS